MDTRPLSLGGTLSPTVLLIPMYLVISLLRVSSGNFSWSISSAASVRLGGTLREGLSPLPFHSETPGPTSEGPPWSLLQRHMESELQWQAGITSVHQDFDYRARAWFYQDINLALFIFIQMPLGGRRNAGPTLNNKTVIKMRIIIIGDSGFDSQQRKMHRKCLWGRANIPRSTFVLLPPPPLSILWCSGGKSCTGARSSPTALPQSPYTKSKPLHLCGALGSWTASTPSAPPLLEKNKPLFP